MPRLKIRLIVNRGGGSSHEGSSEHLRALFAAQGIAPDMVEVAPEDLQRVCEEAGSAEGCDAVVVAGGDGTIGTAAAALAGSGRALGIIPLGTLNHFARDAGIPADPEQAVTTIVHGRRKAVDLAEVNGRIFVNNSGVGLYPDMVRFRDQTQVRTGHSKRAAMLRASLRALRSFRRRRLWIKTEEIEAPVRTPLLFVGNNRYQVNLFALGRREAIDQGELCVYAVRARNRAHLFWAGIRGIFGRLDQQRDFFTAFAKEVEISANRAALTLSLDGETLTLTTPLRYRILPGALTLIVPQEPMPGR
jgi:diacylglycerol kinase family enzyme